MNARLKSLVALLAASSALACAQGCAGLANGQESARAAVAARQSAREPAPAPTTYAPPFPALKRGDEAFESFIKVSGGRAFESREVRQKPPRNDLKVDANYPVLLGDSRPAAREFNRRVRAFVLDDVTPYLEAEPDPEKEKNPFWKDVEEWHSVSHKLIFASDDLVSVLFYVEGYNWGAGHSFHRPVTFNFDLKTGREIRLADLFKFGSRYLRGISRLCVEDLDRQFGPRHVMGDGIKPARRNFASWVVTPGGLVFIFEEYQLVAYSEGEPKVLIPFDRLKEFMRPKGVLTALGAKE